MGAKSYVEEILQEWKPKIKIMISRLGFGAEDKGLLENELLEKVYSCIVEYDDSYDNSFATFTNKCLKNHIQVHIRSEQRKKHAFISDALSLDYCIEEGDTILDLVANPKSPTSDSLIFHIMMKDVMNILPDVCKDIVRMLCDGASETEIARSIGEETALVRGYIEQCIQPLISEVILDEDNHARR